MSNKPYSKWSRGDYDHAEESEKNAYDAWWNREQEAEADRKREIAEQRAAARAARARQSQR